MDSQALWRTYRDLLCHREELGLRLDLSRMGLPEGYLEDMAPALEGALEAMAAPLGDRVAG